MAHILHMTELERWKAGGDVEADSLAEEGFVHASPDEKTLLAVADAFYAAATGPLVALVVDTGVLDSLGVETRWEAAAPAPPPGADDGVLFPHVYGAIPREAVVAVRHLRRAPDGRFTVVREHPAAAEAPDPLPRPEGG
ncbi:DUF952 domain-containing protein [Nocardiopsis sp. NPDC006139]|uniref:DUF952 domain-containing protein n=1 Tax=unclassified Nocardiopsis TaxID=2649073 RepID=UPI0033A2D4DD